MDQKGNKQKTVGNAFRSGVPSASGRVHKSREIGHSVFHRELPSDVYRENDECVRALNDSTEALMSWCEAGTRTTAIFVGLLKTTTYGQMASHLHGAIKQVQDIAGVEMRQMKSTIDAQWTGLSRYSMNQQADPSNDAQVGLVSF